MTVKELIEQLQKLPEDAGVITEDESSDSADVKSVELVRGLVVLLIDGRSLL
ncbi:hypothetical protein [Nostoc sp.]|uniref:hypothetical protein n=1 Tax=Nostoc sp. TaxID=1180 RepID=UPI002FFA7F34